MKLQIKRIEGDMFSILYAGKKRGLMYCTKESDLVLHTYPPAQREPDTFSLPLILLAIKERALSKASDRFHKRVTIMHGDTSYSLSEFISRYQAKYDSLPDPRNVLVFKEAALNALTSKKH